MGDNVSNISNSIMRILYEQLGCCLDEQGLVLFTADLVPGRVTAARGRPPPACIQLC